MAISIDPPRLMQLVDGDPTFRHEARFWTALVRFELGDDAWDASLRDGALVAFEPAGDLSPDIRLAATEELWRNMLARTPQPGTSALSLAVWLGLVLEADVVQQLG